MIPGALSVDHVGFNVPDLEQAVDFFTSVLGGEVVFRVGPARDDEGDSMRRLGAHPRDWFNLAFVRLGPAQNIELIEWHGPDREDAWPAPADTGGPQLAITVADMAAAVAYLQKQEGVLMLGPVATAPDVMPIAGLTNVFFTSPWGLLLELVARPTHLPYEAATTARYWGPASAWHAVMRG